MKTLDRIQKEIAHKQTIEDCVNDMNECAVDPEKILDAIPTVDTRLNTIKATILSIQREWYKRGGIPFNEAYEMFAAKLPQQDIEKAMRMFLQEVSNG